MSHYHRVAQYKTQYKTGSWLISLATLPLFLFGCSQEAEKSVISLIRVRADDVTPDRGDVRLATHQELLTSPFVLEAALRNRKLAELDSVESQEQPVCWLQEKLEVTRSEGSEIIKVAMTGVPTEEATVIVDTVVDEYLEEIATAERRERVARLDTLRRADRDFVDQISRLSTSIHHLSGELGTADNEIAVATRELALERVKSIAARVGGLETELMKADIAMRLANANTENRGGEEPVDSAGPWKSEEDGKSSAAQRHQVIAAVLAEQRQLLGEAEKSLKQRFGFSSDLVVKKKKLEATVELQKQVAQEIAQLERELSQPSQITRVQPAIVEGEDAYACD